ncbi:MAG TPA: hypothetical protein VIJ66_11480 [Solirubrobacteraceae bacterium]
MNGYRAELLTSARSRHGELSLGVLAGSGWRRAAHGREREHIVHGERGEAPASAALRCVSSGYLVDGCSCRARVPAAVAMAAWREELERGRMCEGFFHFAWRGDVWLAYGLADGRVRGVYCPEHRSEREQRLGYDPELALEI